MTDLASSVKKAIPKTQCPSCGKAVYEQEKVIASDGRVFHRPCFRCVVCRSILGAGYGSGQDGKFYCSAHLRQSYQVSSSLTSSQTVVTPDTNGSPPPAGDSPLTASAAKPKTSPYAPAAAKPAARGKGSGAHIVFKREPNPTESAPSKDALFGVSLVELTRRHGSNLDRGFANILASLSPSLLRADGVAPCLQSLALTMRSVTISSASSEEVSQLRGMCDKGNFDGLSACAAGHLLGLLILFLKELPQALLPFADFGPALSQPEPGVLPFITAGIARLPPPHAATLRALLAVLQAAESHISLAPRLGPALLQPTTIEDGRAAIKIAEIILRTPVHDLYNPKPAPAPSTSPPAESNVAVSAATVVPPAQITAVTAPAPVPAAQPVAPTPAVQSHVSASPPAASVAAAPAAASHAVVTAVTKTIAASTASPSPPAVAQRSSAGSITASPAPPVPAASTAATKRSTDPAAVAAPASLLEPITPATPAKTTPVNHTEPFLPTPPISALPEPHVPVDSAGNDTAAAPSTSSNTRPSVRGSSRTSSRDADGRSPSNRRRHERDDSKGRSRDRESEGREEQPRKSGSGIRRHTASEAERDRDRERDKEKERGKDRDEKEVKGSDNNADVSKKDKIEGGESKEKKDKETKEKTEGSEKKDKEPKEKEAKESTSLRPLGVAPLDIEDQRMAAAMQQLDFERARLLSERRRLEEERKSLEAEKRQLRIRLLPSGSMIFKREQIKAEPLAPEVQNELEQLEERKKAKDNAMEVTTHKLQKLKKKLHKIEEEKKELSKTSEDLRATLTEERAAVHDLSHLTEKLTTEMAALENERRKLQVELQTMKADYDRIIVGVVRSAQDAIEGKTKEKKLLGTWKVLELSHSVNLKQEIRHHQSLSASGSPAGSTVSRNAEGSTISTLSNSGSVLAGVDRWGVFQQLDSRLRNTGLIRMVDKFNFEFGNPDLPAFQNVKFEFEEVFVPFYRRYFYDKDHINYIAHSPAAGPLVLTIETGESRLKSILWSSEDHERIILPRWKDKVKTVQLLHPELRSIRFQPLPGQRFADSLLEYERRMLLNKYKFGMLYVAPGQTTEEEWYNNREASPDFTAFLDMIAERIELKDWPHFSGGLHVSGNLTGQYSYYADFRELEVMFHVSTLLPHMPNDPQQLERKRHLGNDIVMFVFLDEACKEPFDPSQIRSHFNHIFIVVQPESRKGVKRYKIAIASKFGVSPYGPWLPERGIYKGGPTLREFLLTKAINAECAALLSPAFNSKLTAARRDHLQLLVTHFLENRPGQVWPVMHNEVKSLRRQTGLRDVRNATALGSGRKNSGEFARSSSPSAGPPAPSSSVGRAEGKDKERVNGRALALEGTRAPSPKIEREGETSPRKSISVKLRDWISPTRTRPASPSMSSAAEKDKSPSASPPGSPRSPRSPRSGSDKKKRVLPAIVTQPFNIQPGSTRRPNSPGRASSGSGVAPPTPAAAATSSASSAGSLFNLPAAPLTLAQPVPIAAPAAVAPSDTPTNSHAELDASSPRSSPGSLGSSSSGTPAASPKPARGESASALPVLKEKEKERESKPATFRLPADVLQALELELHQTAAEPLTESSISLVIAEDPAGVPMPLVPETSGPFYLPNIRQGLAKLEKGLFPAALEHVSTALSALVLSPESTQRANLVKLCVSYKLALRLLIEIKSLERDSTAKPRLAYLTKLLTDFPIFSKHQIICLRMAVQKNMDARNFGVAARLLGELLSQKGLPDQANLELRRKKCEEEKLADATLAPTFVCPVCTSQVSAGASRCDNCARPSSFCYQSWQVLDGKHHTLCGFCGASFSHKVLATGSRCTACEFGEVERVRAFI